MKFLILILSCFLVLCAHGQQLHREAHDEAWTAEQNARELRRLAHE